MFRARYSAENLPVKHTDLKEPMIYQTLDGLTLCDKHARRYVLHMVGRKVTGYICHADIPDCDLCYEEETRD